MLGEDVPDTEAERHPLEAHSALRCEIQTFPGPRCGHGTCTATVTGMGWLQIELQLGLESLGSGPGVGTEERQVGRQLVGSSVSF